MASEPAAVGQECGPRSWSASRWLVVGGLGAGAFGLQVIAAGPASAWDASAESGGLAPAASEAVVPVAAGEPDACALEVCADPAGAALGVAGPESDVSPDQQQQVLPPEQPPPPAEPVEPAAEQPVPPAEQPVPPAEAVQPAAEEPPDTAPVVSDVADPVVLLEALRLEGVLTAEQHHELLGDPGIVEGLDEALAAGGGVVALESSGQAEVDRLLNLSDDQIREVLSGPVDVVAGPSAAQVLALHKLSGGNDFALIELVVNWLAVRQPDLELRYFPHEDTEWPSMNRDAGGWWGDHAGTFGWVSGGEGVGTPFLDTVIKDLVPGDIDRKLEGAAAERTREYQSMNSSSDWHDPTWEEDMAFDHFSFTVVPTMQHLLYENRDNLDRVTQVRSILGLPQPEHWYPGIVSGNRGFTYSEGGPRLHAFQVDDNNSYGSDPRRDSLVVDLLRVQDPGMLAGSRYLLINPDAAVVAGSLGDDVVLQVGGTATIDVGSGSNTVVLASGSTASVVEGSGDLGVRTVASPVSTALATGDPSVLDGPAPGVDLSLTTRDGIPHRDGMTVVRMTADGSFTGSLSGEGSRHVEVAEGATVEVTGAVASEGSAADTLVVRGLLTGGDAGGAVDLGGGDDVVASTADSLVRDLTLGTGAGDDKVSLRGTATTVGVDLGHGDDTATVAGGMNELRVELGRGNDRLVVLDTATGDLSVSDQARSWVKSGKRKIHENDQVLIVSGEGQVSAIDPDDPGAGVVRVDPVTGEAVATITVDGVSRQVEIIGVVDDTGTVTTLQQISPEVRRQAGFLGFLANALKIGGLVTGQLYLSAAGSALGGAHDVVNGADPFTTMLTTGTGIAGPASGVSWLAPAGQTAVSVGTGDWTNAALGGLAVAAGIDASGSRTSVAESPFARLAGTVGGGLTVARALDDGDALGVLSGGLGVADSATGVSDQGAYDRVGSVLGLARAATTGDLWAAASRAVTAYQAFQPSDIAAAPTDEEVTVPALEFPTSRWEPPRVDEGVLPGSARFSRPAAPAGP